jgi:N-acetylated-alpha-linked acidic dipeptidase
MGASDPLSGQTAMLEEAKAIGALAKTGWRPKRTIVYTSWDGEEPGLLGSTEWVEEHGPELARKAVLYVNSDGNGRGILHGEGSYFTLRLATQAAEDVKDPETGVSVAKRERAVDAVRAAAGGGEGGGRRSAKADADGDLAWGPLGSGSDYSPFAQHQGVASIDLGFGGEGSSGGVYHSLYDDFEHYDRFGDPGFHYEVALAQTAGRIVLRAADAEVTPFAFANLAEKVSDQLGELKRLHTETRDKTAQTDKLLDAGAYRLAADPTLGFANPEREGAVPDLDFKPLDSAVAKLKASAEAYDKAAASAPSLDAGRRTKLNALLLKAEQTLLDPDGLPGRPWYKHLLYAPGVLTGYGSKTLPGVREAIEGRRWDEAQAYIARTAKVLESCAKLLDDATTLAGA